MRSYISHGQTIDVEFRPFGAFLWLVAGFVVRVGSRTFYPRLTRIRLTTETEFDFDVDGRRVTGVVRSLNPMWLLRKRYVVIIGDCEVARDIQILQRWYLSFISWGVAFIFFLFTLIGVIYVWSYFR